MSAFLAKWATEPDRQPSGPPIPTASAETDADSPGGTSETTPDPRAASPNAADREQEPNLAAAGVEWAEWRAATLNRLFAEQGVTRQPGRITAATVRHGERKAGGNG